MENDLFVLSLIWKALMAAFAEARATDEVLWMNGATWAQLWSGVIGAVAGAGVAMHVLRKTLREQATIATKNEQVQRELAEIAASAQAALAAKQLTEQREALERQLAEQRDALQLQLEEQRREASLNREHAAIADVIAVIAESVEPALSSTSEADRAIRARVAAATGRWQIETDNPRLRGELEKWSAHWSTVVAAKRRPATRGMTSKEARGLLADTIRKMLDLSRSWTHASDEERKDLLDAMADVRAAIPPKIRDESTTLSG
ncbi:hypothetical protein [Paenarthrobacter ureafaciens]|uniref:hypothetical protein n=1 Tax=Paenarthrobacter ureafaciens TaxID=37931 RepID=UPI001FB1FEE3|nr:hypothetical protein [Paenarthrobacter ureafaciens]UOD80321.1 hypothetical protein MQZ73_14530 [Paenarthrobacter ureafaciens]WNZ04329.1 hypothetical protein PVT25_01860 [Paenarthrobacter ureafaciens]